MRHKKYDCPVCHTHLGIKKPNKNNEIWCYKCKKYYPSERCDVGYPIYKYKYKDVPVEDD